MRICMLVRQPFTRDARIAREAATLVDAGHEVTVIATAGPTLPRREERDGLAIRRIAPLGPLAGPTIRGAASAQAGADRRSRPPAAVWLRDELLDAAFSVAAMRTDADVYHAHDLPVLAAAIRAGARNGAQVVFDAHELYTELAGLTPGERARWHKVEARLIGQADAVLVASEARAEEMARRYGIELPTTLLNCPPRGNGPVIPSGPVGALRRPGELLAVYTGGYIEGRGLDDVVAAVGLVPGLRLAMIGWGPIEQRLRDRARTAGVDDRVHFLPPVEPDQVSSAVAAADAGLAPYLPIGLNNVLCAPNKLAEYLHAGLAVAASDLPDLRRVVHGEGLGVLFDAGDVGSIAIALAQLRDAGPALEAMRTRSRAVADRFTWEAQATKLLDVYAQLGAERRAA